MTQRQTSTGSFLDFHGVSPVQSLAEAAPWASAGGAAVPDIKFSMRCNVTYNLANDTNPAPGGRGTSINAGDFLDVAAAPAGGEWWVARITHKSPEFFLIPSPAAMEKKAASQPASSRPRANSVRRASSGFLGGLSLGAAKPGGDAVVVRLNKKIPFYDLAPRIRPIVFVGPGKLSYDVTDRLQQALIHYLTICFNQMCDQVIITRDEFNGKRRTSSVGGKSGQEEPFTPEQLKKIYSIIAAGKIPLIQIDSENISSLRGSELRPIVCLIRLPIKVFNKLIKQRDNRNSRSQMVTAEKFNSLDGSHFDVVLSNSKLDCCCYELAAYIDAHVSMSSAPADVDPELFRQLSLGVAGI